MPKARAKAAVKAAPTETNALPTDMQVVGAVQRASTPATIVMGAAGTMPGELHKIWDAPQGGYHMEYGFSCMGYEIAGGLGIKMAEPDRDVIVMVGDGSYMMMNSELATAVGMGVKITVVITDNRGYGCINRLQMGTGGAEFNEVFLEEVRIPKENVLGEVNGGWAVAMTTLTSERADIGAGHGDGDAADRGHA